MNKPSVQSAVRQSMGTEILYIFLPVPILIWCWNIWQLRKKETRLKAAILLFLGFAFIAYICLPLTSAQYFMQGLLFGSFAYGPFYLLAWLVVTASLKLAKGKERRISEGRNA